MGKQLDLTGQRFGKLIVIGVDPNYVPKSGRHKTWLCKCDCGNYKVARGTRLISGYTTACSAGCKNRIEVGTHFGKLVVLEMTNERSKNGGSMMYRCRCDCGEELLVPSTELRANRKSCCSKCKMSLGAITIETLLKENNIDYIKEYVIYDTYNNEPMQKYRFDFFLPQYNIIIEYDGEQHTKPIEKWGGIEGLKKTQQRDRIKTNYCLDNGITIIRIPYSHTHIVIDDLLDNSSFKIMSKMEE
ncbi:MAG: hypothetical protein IKF29_16890 [Oceanobacillus sp.]|nr:hypothetical protein [Oceanobacillus sp.]